MTDQSYVPALGFKPLTPLYDHVVPWLFQEARFKQQLLAQAQLEPHHRILDLGCGTGTLTLMITQAVPASQVYGVDIDPAMLAMAQHKAASQGVALRMQRGSAAALPYRSEQFDRVVSSLVIHHLPSGAKQAALNEAFRVLRPGGEIHLADVGEPRTRYTRLVAHLTRHFEEIAANLTNTIPGMLEQAGFAGVSEGAALTTVLGTLILYRGQKPAT